MARETPESTKTPPPAAAPAQSQQGQAEIHLDDSATHPLYANFARVTATPEEVIIDLALNPNPFTQGRQDVKVSQRIVMNFFTAKRLWAALRETLARHEQTFGTIELDVRRRATPGALGGGQAQGQTPPPAPKS